MVSALLHDTVTVILSEIRHPLNYYTTIKLLYDYSENGDMQ